MKRRTWLHSKTPLKPGKPLVRRTPLREVGRKGIANGRKPAKDTGPDRATKDLVKERDDWHCVICGKPVVPHGDWSIHHRRNRGTGGSSDPAINRPSNLILVHGSGTTLCHGDLTDNRDRDFALEHGWVISTNSKQEPIDVPVHHALHGLIYLDDEGTWSPVPQVDGDAA